MAERSDSIGRRTLLQAVAAAATGDRVLPAGLLAQVRAANPIVEENRKPGTTDWQLTFIRSENHRSEAIEGYCSRTSVKPGESLDVFLSADRATDVTMDVYRMGYYGGKGGRHVTRLGPFPVRPQPTPPVGPNRLRECRWARTTTLAIPRDWLSGVYLGKLSCTGHRYQSYVVFVVRDDRKADLLVQTSDLAWQGYNEWPGGHSLHDTDPPNRPSNATTRVSFERPYGKYPQVVDQPLSQGSGEFLLWEFPLCYWLERQGYDVTYWSNLDTHTDPAGLDRVKCFVSVGHDEFWTLEMYDHVHSAVRNGLSVAFLCGNSVHWVVSLETPSASGRRHRVLYRTGRFGGLPPEYLATVAYSASEPWERHGPGEALLVGARTMTPVNGAGDWTVTNAGHWILEGTGMSNGDRLPGMVGWEHHGGPADLPGLEVIAAGKTMKAGGEESPYAATVYPGPRGNWVFNAATIYWALGLARTPGQILPFAHLARPHGMDERVQRITANFLNRCGVRPG